MEKSIIYQLIDFVSKASSEEIQREWNHVVRLGYSNHSLYDLFAQRPTETLNTTKLVRFKPLEFLDGRKGKCELEIGEVFEGTLSANGKLVRYTDVEKIDWIFYVGSTCELVE